MDASAVNEDAKTVLNLMMLHLAAAATHEERLVNQ